MNDRTITDKLDFARDQLAKAARLHSLAKYGPASTRALARMAAREASLGLGLIESLAGHPEVDELRDALREMGGTS